MNVKEVVRIEYPNKTDICKGLIFKAKANQYINSNGQFVSTNRLVPVKRKSCLGCEKCHWLVEHAGQDIINGNDLMPVKFKHDCLYQLKVIDWSRDYESGYVDDFIVGFVERGKDDKR